MNNTRLTFELGVQAFEKRDYYGAVDRFVRVLESEPHNAQVREYLARAYYYRASLPLAEEQLRIILDRDPTDEYAMLMLARTLERQSRHDEAGTIRRTLAALTGDERHLVGHSPAR